MRKFVFIIFLLVCSMVGSVAAQRMVPPKPVNHYAGDGGIRIPYKEVGGVKFVHVHINNVGVDMIFDTGCSSTLLSASEYYYMVDKGLITRDDILGIGNAQIADGSVVQSLLVNLREVRLNDKLVFRNVVAEVSPNLDAPLLLGNEVLNQVKSYKIDNKNKQIVFYLL